MRFEVALKEFGKEMKISNFFFKNRKSMCRCEIIKNRYYEMKAHALNVFPNDWYD